MRDNACCVSTTFFSAAALDRRHAVASLAASLVGAACAPLPAVGRGASGAPSAAPSPAPVPPLSVPPIDTPPGDPFWDVVRAQYPLTRDRVYFNTGGLGPASFAALDAAARTTAELQRLSETGHSLLEASRAPLAAFLGCGEDELAFTRNATEANSTIASGLKAFGPGDEVLFDSHAHPGGSIPWMSRALQYGSVCRIFEPDAATPEELVARIEAALTPKTRVIQVSHITAPTGILMPAAQIAELARRRGLWFHIDGAQSMGMVPVDVKALGCDSYGTSGHKWLGAPHGTGLLYIRRERLDEIAPTEVGAYSDNGIFALPDTLSYSPSARRFEPGTRDAAGIVGMAAAAAFMTQLGMDRVRGYGHALARRLAAGLRTLPGVTVLSPGHPALATSITTFKVDRVPYDRLYSYLLGTHKMRARIVTEQGLNALRVSTHIFNSAEEVDRLLGAVATAARDGVPG